MRALLSLAVVVLLLAVGAWMLSSRQIAPAIDIRQPATVLGQAGTVEVAITAPRGALSRLDVRLEQGSRQFPLFSLPGDANATLTQESEDVVQLVRPVTKRELPELTAGPARVVVDAARETLFGLRSLEAQATRDLLVRLDPPRVSVVSVHHYINHGGSELVVYKATPPEVESGVRVGDVVYPGFPAADAGVTGADPSLKVTFFALLHDQDLETPIQVFARDEAGNEARTSFDFRVFPKPFRRSTIAVEDDFLRRVVPPILERTPELSVADPSDLVAAFLTVNGDLRQLNAEALMALAGKTTPRVLWNGPFRQLTNSQVESSFADQRTYTYGGKEIDRQVHLGFDLAVTANVAVQAANRGVVVYADYLGIYGNCVVVDHGMGLQSLYAHLSSMDVRPGDIVEREQTLGRSGMTGLAGGDHLHFTMLLQGHPVTPVDWWSAQWVEDRILRKLRDAGGGAAITSTP